MLDDEDLLSHPILHLVEVLRHPARKVACCRHIVPWQVLAHHIRYHRTHHFKPECVLLKRRKSWQISHTVKVMSKDVSNDQGSRINISTHSWSSSYSLVSDLFENSLEELGSDSQHLFFHPYHKPFISILSPYWCYEFGFLVLYFFVWFLLLVFKSWYSSYLSLCSIVEAGHKNVVSNPNPATFIVVSF